MSNSPEEDLSSSSPEDLAEPPFTKRSINITGGSFIESNMSSGSMITVHSEDTSSSRATCTVDDLREALNTVLSNLEELHLSAEEFADTRTEIGKLLKALELDPPQPGVIRARWSVVRSLSSAIAVPPAIKTVDEMVAQLFGQD